jgi:hypothetical protein
MPSRYQRFDLFIKVLSLLCPNLTDDSSISQTVWWKCSLFEIEGNREGKGHPDEDKLTLRCQQNPFIGALRIQEPVMPGEPLIEG